MSAYVLNLAVLVPLLGALLLLFIPRTRTQTIERCSVWISLAPLLLSTLLWSGGSVLEARNGFAVDWLPAFHIRYSLGVDGFSIPMVFLTAVLSTVCLFYSAGRIKNPKFDQALEEVRRFEQMLIDEGAVILKFWMHLSRLAQKRRLKKLESDPLTRWRVDLAS